MPDEVDDLARWLIREQASINIEGQIAITKKASAGGERTIVAMDHRLFCPLPGRASWRVTTKKTYLPPRHFHSAAAHTLKTAAGHGRGRTIYCMDHALDDEVVAALSYHLDERRSWPLFITAIAFRIDFPNNAVLRRRTLEAAFLLKQYAHAIATLTGRGSDVHVEVPPTAVTRYAEELRFIKAPRLKGLRSSGMHMRQPPLASQSSPSRGT